ncbi:DoxX family protein [Croceivirga sp. JEA036]|uniref:DoxX family protein n=1 Tax=Croceivirga sp. JEA036 TaxID=2721162 RepID=UPI0039775823
MLITLKFIILFSAFSFLLFGLSCLFSPLMTLEFKRYELHSYQKITGILQILGAISLAVGLYFTPLLLLGSYGLSLLMFSGFLVRISLKDSIWKTLPSFCFALLNLYAFILSIIFV